MASSNLPQATSTWINPTYLRSNYLTNITVVRNGQKIVIPEFFAPAYVNIRNALRPQGFIRYNNSSKIPALSKKYYQNTSAWWMIMQMNGYIHPYTINPGTFLYLPDIKAAVKQTNQPTNVRTVNTKSI